MNSSPPNVLTAIGQIAINIREVERSIAFYRDTLGLPLLFRTPDLGFFDCGGVRLMLSKPSEPEFDHASSVLYFKVGDIRQTFDDLTGKGVKFRGKPHLIAKMPDHELWMAFFDDSEGNVMALMSEVRA